MPWDPTTQAAIDRALAALAQPSTPMAPGPSPFQETAAARAMRLWRQAGPGLEMENDARFRMNFLGNNLQGSPATVTHAQRMGYQPLEKLYQANDVAEGAFKRQTASRKPKPKRTL